MHDNAGAEQTHADLTTLLSYNEHPELAEDFYECIWNSSDLGAFFELFAEGFSFCGSLGPQMRGHEIFKDYVHSVRGALGDYHCENLECVAEGNRVFARMRFS